MNSLRISKILMGLSTGLVCDKIRLFPNKLEHLTAKKDGAGNLITAVEPLKRLYTDLEADQSEITYRIYFY